MHTATLFLDLRDAGVTLFLRDGQLFGNPDNLITPEHVALIKEHKPALIAWLMAADDDNARIDAIAKRAAEFNPFDKDSPSHVFRDSVLIRLHNEDERPEYLAVDPVYLAELEAWCDTKLRLTEAKKFEKEQKKVAKTRRKRKTEEGGLL